MPAPKNTVYVIRCLQSGAHKIGITGDWGRRSRQLEVGSKTATVRVVRVNDGPQLEKWLHRRYKAVRLPQTEWFHLSADQLEHVLSALEKASSDHREACVRQQGDLTRPRFEARQRVISSKPGPPTPAQQAASGPATNEHRTRDQVRQARAREHAQQTAAYQEMVRKQEAREREAERLSADCLPEVARTAAAMAGVVALAFSAVALTSALFNFAESARKAATAEQPPALIR